MEGKDIQSGLRGSAARPAEAPPSVSDDGFRLLIESVKDYAILMLDAQGRVVSWNIGAERIKGYRADEILGKHISIFYPRDAVERGWPEHELDVARREGRFEDEGWRIRKDGSRLWANVIITALRDDQGNLAGFAKITRDLTERRRAEMLFRGLLESAPDAMVIVNAQGDIVIVNGQAEKLFGYGRDDLIGQPVEVLVPEDARIKHLWRTEKYPVTPVDGPIGVGLELYGVRKDGSRFPVEISLSPLETEGGLLVSSAIRDITERRRAERKLQQFAAQLQRSNRELEQFASVAAHDLQEPLRKIEAFGDRLESKCGKQLGEQGKDYLARMQNSARRMRNLINDLLAFSRISTNARPFQRVDLKQVAQEVVSDLEGSIQQTDGRVEVGDLPVVEADRLQMRQLLQNLTGNALKFHKPEEPPVVTVCGRVVTELDGNRFCELTVQDNGIGFEEQYLDRIFEVFQRLHGRQEYEGTGMGLAICRKILHRHGGTISAASLPGQGTTFTARLPLSQPKDEEDDGEASTVDHDPDGR